MRLLPNVKTISDYYIPKIIRYNYYYYYYYILLLIIIIIISNNLRNLII